MILKVMKIIQYITTWSLSIIIFYFLISYLFYGLDIKEFFYRFLILIIGLSAANWLSREFEDFYDEDIK